MTLTKNQFFLLLTAVFICPFFLQKMIWLLGSEGAVAEMRFVGHGNLGSTLGISTYPVLRFVVNGDTVYFNGNVDTDLKQGDDVPVRYQRNNPGDAVIDSCISIWMPTVAYALLPILVLTVLYILPDSLDPIVPRRAKMIIGKNPFLRIVKNED